MNLFAQFNLKVHKSKVIYFLTCALVVFAYLLILSFLIHMFKGINIFVRYSLDVRTVNNILNFYILDIFFKKTHCIFFHDHENGIKALKNKLGCPDMGHSSVYDKHLKLVQEIIKFIQGLELELGQSP